MPNVDRDAPIVTCSEPEREPSLTVYPGKGLLTAMDIWMVERQHEAPFDAVLVRVVTVRRGFQLLVLVRPRIDDRENGGPVDDTFPVHTYH